MIPLAIVAAAALLAGVWWLNERHAERHLAECLRRRAVVTLKDSTSFTGVLWAADRHCLILRNAALIEEQGASPVDGEVTVFRSEVSFVQLP